MEMSYGREDSMMHCLNTCLLLTFVLRKSFEGYRKKDKQFVGFNEICADKIMRLCDKLWEKRPDKKEREESGRIVDFCLKRDFNDKHGHRVAFPIADEIVTNGKIKLVPVLKAIEIIDKYVSPEAKMHIRHIEETTWGPVTRLEPQVGTSRLLPLIKRNLIDSSDMKLLEYFGDAFACIPEREIIALGRHETANDTMLSILWELDRWKQSTEEVFNKLDKYEDIDTRIANNEVRLLWENWSIARECLLKTSVYGYDAFWSDRIAYEKAIKTLFKPNTGVNQDVLNLLSQVQHSSEKIWEDPRVSYLGFTAFCCWSFSNYFIGTLFKSNLLKDHVFSSRLSSVDEKDVIDAFHQVKKCVLVARENRPQHFYLNYLHTVRGVPPDVIVVDMNPQDVWKGKIVLRDFIKGAETIANWIIETHINPDLENLRIQNI